MTVSSASKTLLGTWFENVHASKVKFLGSCQKVCKLVRFISKPRDVVHDNNLIKYIIFTHYNINIIVNLSLSLKKYKVHIKLICSLRILEINMLLETGRNIFFLFQQKEAFSISKISPLGLHTFCFLRVFV